MCTFCPPGQFSSSTGTSCVTMCPAGQYGNSTTSNGCVSCPTGQFSSSTGTSCVTACPTAQYYGPYMQSCQFIKSRDCDYVKGAWELMNGPISTFTNSTTNAAYCCGSNGVTCSGSTVTQITWTAQSLSSSLPLTLGYLTNVTSLYLVFFNIQINWFQCFNWPDSGFFFRLDTINRPVYSQHLIFRNLDNNDLNGTIPTWLGSLPLTYL